MEKKIEYVLSTIVVLFLMLKKSCTSHNPQKIYVRTKVENKFQAPESHPSLNPKIKTMVRLFCHLQLYFDITCSTRILHLIISCMDHLHVDLTSEYCDRS